MRGGRGEGNDTLIKRGRKEMEINKFFGREIKDVPGRGKEEHLIGQGR